MEKNKHKFKVGDIVQYGNDFHLTVENFHNMLGRIISCEQDLYYKVDVFDKRFVADRWGPMKTGWLSEEKELKLYNPTLTKFIEEMEKEK